LVGQISLRRQRQYYFDDRCLRDYSDSTPDVSFFYDGRGLPSIPNFSKGKTTKVTSSVSESRYTSFDNQGRLLTNQQITDGQTYQSSYQYDAFGKLLTETYPSGRTVTNNLDQNGDLESVWGTKSNQTSAKVYLNQISYNSSGAIEKMRLGNGRWETAVYNSRLQVTQIGLGYSNTDKSLLKIDYDYGNNTQNNGSLREQKINYTGLSSEIKQSYIYDDLNRLKSATETFNSGTQQSWKQTFNYDRFGNRTFDAANTTTLSQSVSSKVKNPLINTADNRLKKDQDNDSVTDYDFDKAGNLILDAENQKFIYDAENHLKQFSKERTRQPRPTRPIITTAKASALRRFPLSKP
jgi:YD repeat-containing protein